MNSTPSAGNIFEIPHRGPISVTGPSSTRTTSIPSTWQASPVDVEHRRQTRLSGTLIGSAMECCSSAPPPSSRTLLEAGCDRAIPAVGERCVVDPRPVRTNTKEKTFTQRPLFAIETRGIVHQYWITSSKPPGYPEFLRNPISEYYLYGRTEPHERLYGRIAVSASELPPRDADACRPHGRVRRQAVSAPWVAPARRGPSRRLKRDRSRYRVATDRGSRRFNPSTDSRAGKLGCVRCH